MKLRLHSLKLTCRASEEIVLFAKNVSFFHGTLSSGKSSIARLIDFCLGGDLEQTTALVRELVSAQLSLTLGAHEVLLERNRDENQVQATWKDKDDNSVTVLIRAKGDGAPVVGQDVVNMSDLILYLLGYSVIRVRKRTSDEESPLVRLSFRDIFKFCYLEQEELDSSFFRLNTPILAEKSKDALNFFTGYYSETLSNLESELDSLRSEQRSKREAAERIKMFLAQFGYESETQIQGELNNVQHEIDSLQRELNLDNASYLHETHFVDEQRDQLRELSDRLQSEKVAISDIDEHVEQQRELRAELISMKFKTARADRAKNVLGGSVFDHCPNCGQAVSSSRSVPDGPCYLCLQPILSGEGRELNPATVQNDLDARIEDLEASLRRHESARRRQLARISDLTATKARLDREVAELLTTYESDRLARTRYTEQQLAALRERVRFLTRIREMPSAVAKMLQEADAISSELNRLQRAIADEQKRLSFADKNFSDLAQNFLEALLAVKEPGVEPNDKVVFNRRTLVPEIWPEGDKNQAYSFYTSGSGGKKTLITICFALALHRTAARNKMPVPTLLIIDTPLKNITPDINPELVEAFYRYLYAKIEGDLGDNQLIIIDQLLVRPPENSPLEFSERYMTTGDPEHPPLISYYEGP
jgi:hypothetical protein